MLDSEYLSNSMYMYKNTSKTFICGCTLQFYLEISSAAEGRHFYISFNKSICLSEKQIRCFFQVILLSRFITSVKKKKK